MVRRIKCTSKGCGSCGNGVTGFGSDCLKDADKGCGSWDRVIGMKGTDKG